MQLYMAGFNPMAGVGVFAAKAGVGLLAILMAGCVYVIIRKMWKDSL